MKKFLSLLLAAMVVCAGLAGCGEGTETGSDGGPLYGEPPSNQTIATLPDGLGYRAISGTDEVEIYAVDREKVQILSGKIALPSYLGNMPVTRIAENTFLNCEKIVEIELPQYLTSIGGGCFTSSGLTRITIPEGVTAILTSTFEQCTSLEEIKFPSSLLEIGLSAFKGATSLKHAVFPNGLLRIANEAFKDCPSLDSRLVIPASVEWIGFKAFYHSGVRAVMIPQSVEGIGAMAFDHADIYTEREKGQKNWSYDDVSGAFDVKWRDDVTQCYYSSEFRYDGDMPYVYSIKGIEKINRISDYDSDSVLESIYESLQKMIAMGKGNYLASGSASCVPFRDGYEFKGWSMTEGSDTVDFAAWLFDPYSADNAYFGYFDGIEDARYYNAPYMASLSTAEEMIRITPYMPLFAVWEPISPSTASF